MKNRERFAWVAMLCRVVLGAVFVFSGLTKGIDPWGTAPKIREYLDAFGLAGFSSAAGALAVGQCVAELVVGLMLLCGTGLRLAGFIALLCMAFFTLLTLVIAVWNPVDDCGCFGDALRLSNWMTFAKNAVLLPMAAVVWRDAQRRRGWALSRREAVRTGVFVLVALALNLYAWYGLPPVDGSAYRKGTDLRRDVLCTGCMDRAVVLVYEDLQTGAQREFSLSDTTWYDTARWRYVDTRTPYDDLPERAREYDFALWQDGTDRVAEVVYASGTTVLVLVRDAEEVSGHCRERIRTFARKAGAAGMRVACVVGAEQPEELPAGVGEELGIGVIYGMDRRLMAQLLRADAGAVKITDGVIADKRPCRTMEKLLERALVEEAAER